MTAKTEQTRKEINHPICLETLHYYLILLPVHAIKKEANQNSMLN